jgi:hypothetical protein
MYVALVRAVNLLIAPIGPDQGAYSLLDVGLKVHLLCHLPMNRTILGSEDGPSMFLRNIRISVQDDAASHHKAQIDEFPPQSNSLSPRASCLSWNVLI